MPNRKTTSFAGSARTDRPANLKPQSTTRHSCCNSSAARPAANGSERSAATTLDFEDVSTALDDEIAGTATLDLLTTSGFTYTDEGVDESEENSTFEFVISATEETSLAVLDVTEYTIDDEDYLPSTTMTLTLTSESSTSFTGEGTFEEGLTSGTFEVSSTTTTELLYTEEATAVVTAWTDVEAGKVRQVALAGESSLLMTIESHSSQASEFTTYRESGGGGGGGGPPGPPGPPGGGGGGGGSLEVASTGGTSAATDVLFTITGEETYSGTLTTMEHSGYYVPPPNTITTSGEMVTVGEIESTFTYTESGDSSDSHAAGGITTETTSEFSTSLNSFTCIDILATETIYSEWTYLNLGEEDEDVVGFAQLDSQSSTELVYHSGFSFDQSTEVETTGSYWESTITTVVDADSVSHVESAYSTDDSYLVERELVEGQVVQSSETEITGDFDTTATVTSTTETNVDGTYHAEIEPYYGPGPVSLGSMEADETFSDERTTSNTMTMSQSGSYGHGENDSSSSSLSVESVDEYFSRIDGEMHWSDGYVDTDAEWWYEESGSSEKTFSQSESFTPQGNSASWSTSLEREREWEVHSTTTLFVYATDADDSGSESYSESSGGQSYTPNEEDNPSNNYNGRTSPFGDGGNGGGEGQNGESGGANAQSPRRIINPGLPKDVVDLLLQNGQAARGTGKYKGIVGILVEDDAGNRSLILLRYAEVFEWKDFSFYDSELRRTISGEARHATGEYHYEVYRVIPLGNSKYPGAISLEELAKEVLTADKINFHGKAFDELSENNKKIARYQAIEFWLKQIPIVGTVDEFSQGHVVNGLISLGDDVILVASVGAIGGGAKAVKYLRVIAVASAAQAALAGGAAGYHYYVGEDAEGNRYLIRSVVSAAGTVTTVFALRGLGKAGAASAPLNNEPQYKTWNQFQAGTAGQFATRSEAAAAWSAYKQTNGIIIAGTKRSAAARARFLKNLAGDPNTPKWMRQWLLQGKVPPGYDVDHIIPLSIGGLDSSINMRLQLRELHRLHHYHYHPWITP